MIMFVSWFSPPGFFNGDIKDISIMIAFSYFSHWGFRSFAHHIIFKSSDFPTEFFEDHIIHLIFPCGFSERLTLWHMTQMFKGELYEIFVCPFEWIDLFSNGPECFTNRHLFGRSQLFNPYIYICNQCQWIKWEESFCLYNLSRCLILFTTNIRQHL
jgi:hypothetical protein